MFSDKNIEENFKFIVLEVTKQTEDACKILKTPSEKSIKNIMERDDYIDNLKGSIEDKCLSHFVNSSSADKNAINFLRAVTVISSNLERIGDYAVNIAKQSKYLKNADFIKQFDYKIFFSEILGALEIIVEVLLKRDISRALKICRSEFNLDQYYEKNFKKILKKLNEHSRDNNCLVTTLFIFHYLERMGDALLNIGEAIIFSVMGEKLRIHQYQALSNGLESPLSDVVFKSIWGTRSGCRIGRVHGKDKTLGLIFKEGNFDKLAREKQNIERWEKLWPGLVPKVIRFHSSGSNASIILECINGQTLKEIILNEDISDILKSFSIIKKNIREIWTKTMKRQSIRSNFIDQISSRVKDVYKAHPYLKIPAKQISSLTSLSFDELLEKARVIEEELAVPFSVMIHGDFNIDNMICDFEKDKVFFIDLHRSAEKDYVQDVSVFLVSGFRLPVFDQPIRNKLNQVSIDFFQFAKDFAAEHRDSTFEARLSLGIIRSLFTSTRFVLNKKFAKTMYLRAFYLLEKIADHHGRPWEDYHLTEEIFIY